jgi:hypothetical protein
MAGFSFPSISRVFSNLRTTFRNPFFWMSLRTARLRMRAPGRRGMVSKDSVDSYRVRNFWTR